MTGIPERERTDLNRTGGRAGLAPLDQLDDFKVADEDPDVRGWAVKDSAGQKIGEVHELIVDPAAMRVRYLDVELDRRGLNLNEDRHILVPVGCARLDDADDEVFIGNLTRDRAVTAPAFRHGAITRDFEQSVQGCYEPLTARGDLSPRDETDDFYGSEWYDERRLFGGRRRGRETQPYVISSRRF